MCGGGVRVSHGFSFSILYRPLSFMPFIIFEPCPHLNSISWFSKMLLRWWSIFNFVTDMDRNMTCTEVSYMSWFRGWEHSLRKTLECPVKLHKFLLQSSLHIWCSELVSKVLGLGWTLSTFSLGSFSNQQICGCRSFPIKQANSGDGNGNWQAVHH